MRLLQIFKNTTEIFEYEDTIIFFNPELGLLLDFELMPYHVE
jgi:hypothetical protein